MYQQEPLLNWAMQQGQCQMYTRGEKKPWHIAQTCCNNGVQISSESNMCKGTFYRIVGINYFLGDNEELDKWNMTSIILVPVVPPLCTALVGTLGKMVAKGSTH